MSVKIQSVTKIYKSNRGVYDISFEVNKGEVYGLLGPNGAGKTTILKMLVGLLHKGKGLLAIDGIDIDSSPERYKQEIVGIIGDTVLYDYMSPMDHLEMMHIHFGEISTEDKFQVLRDMDLYQYKDEPVKQFSTGMKQRLAFAMCIVGRPKVLLLDEPFSGLDIEGKLLIRNKICELRDHDNMAIIISSHLIHDLEEVATNVGIIKNGHLIDEQEVHSLMHRYKNLEAYFIDKTLKYREGA